LVGSIGPAGQLPCVRDRIVTASGPLRKPVGIAAPENRFRSRPHAFRVFTTRRRTGGAGLLPSVSRRIVASAGIQEDVAETAPHDHLCARPYRRVQAASAWHIHGAGRQPAIGLRVVTSSVVVELEVVVEPSPENHFLPGPNRSYALTIGRRVGRIGR